MKSAHRPAAPGLPFRDKATAWRRPDADNGAARLDLVMIQLDCLDSRLQALHQSVGTVSNES